MGEDPHNFPERAFLLEGGGHAKFFEPWGLWECGISGFWRLGAVRIVDLGLCEFEGLLDFGYGSRSGI